MTKLEERAVSSGKRHWGEVESSSKLSGYAIGFLDGWEDLQNTTAKWIRENIGAEVAVDYLRAIEEQK